MRSLIYLISLLIFVYVGGPFYFSRLWMAFYDGLFPYPPPNYVAYGNILGLAIAFTPKIALLGRLYLLWARRSWAAPSSFRGILLVVCALPVVALAVIIGGYVLVALTARGPGGMSGIPLGFALLGIGFVVTICIPIVEILDWYSYLTERSSAKTSPNNTMETDT